VAALNDMYGSIIADYERRERVMMSQIAMLTKQLQEKTKLVAEAQQAIHSPKES
jgi:hypothetical protein